MGLWSKQPSEEDLRKYGRAVLLGPLPFALYALVVLVAGPILINASRRPENETGSLTTLYPNWRCKTSYEAGSPITDEAKGTNPLYNVFLYWFLNITCCYFFQMTFCWTFIGFPFTINDFFSCWNAVLGIDGYTFTVGPVDINLGTKLHMLSDNINVHLGRPYTKLRWVAGVYVSLFALIVLVNFLGLYYMMNAGSAGCWELNPKLFYFTLFQVLLFFSMAFLKLHELCKYMCGTAIGARFRNAATSKYKAATTADDDAKFVRQKFMQYDQGGDQPQMEADDLQHLLADLGLHMKEAEVETIKSSLAGDDAIISLDEFMGWYSQPNDGEQKRSAQSDSEGEQSSDEVASESD